MNFFNLVDISHIQINYLPCSNYDVQKMQICAESHGTAGKKL